MGSKAWNTTCAMLLTCAFCGCFGQLCFRQKGSDKNHTSLGPCRLSAIYGFAFTSDQVCPEESLDIGLIFGTCLSHGFGIYSHVFGVYPSKQWFSQALQK